MFNFIKMIEQSMETLSGVNSVARGNPESSLKSGTALALVQSMSLQFLSGLQQSYVELVEDVGTAVVKMLQDFANTPRLIAISGKKNRGYMKEFCSDDITSIGRVAVDIGNPMSRTTAGRVQMAQELIQYSVITPKQYVNVIQTGSLDDLTEDLVNENLLMRAENEAILDGESPIMTITDSHKEHIDYHRGLLFDPDLRKDAKLVTLVQNHIQEHIQALRTTDPDLLMLMGQQPLHPPGPPPAPPGAPGPAGPPPQGPQGPSAPPQGSPPPAPTGPQQPGQPQGPHHVQSGQKQHYEKRSHHSGHLGANDAKNLIPPQNGISGPNIQGNSLMGPGMQKAQHVPTLPRVPASALTSPDAQQQALGNVNPKK